MDLIKDWVRDIIVLSVFISILETLLPNGDMKKYVNVIIGLMIIIVLINPFIYLINDGIDIEREVFIKTNDYNISVNGDNEDLQKAQEEQIINVYKRKIKTDIMSFINAEGNMIVDDINIYLKETKEEMGEVKNIEVIMRPEVIKHKKDSSDNINVNVTLDNSNIKQDSKDYERVRKKISKRYNINEENIVFIP
ncbi:stage III sporulation protein AF [Clostridiisalibacter paucivorans]|uniref:stage III sporulation protein AF n=1 Tax=Clostridiisalibacter paucivorans TaxID=408753 RepID=UPI0006873F91|nr:stage III sporulation protein AF [Clostridiisalibacter paucivorans]